MEKRLKIFYNDKQSVNKDIQLVSPSAAKPGELVKRWSNSGQNIQIVDFSPVTKEDFYLAHDKSFVDDVLSGQRQNGFGTKHLEVAAALPWTTGSFYAAALAALQNNEITCSPTSGFHHAEYSQAMGYCTFNGLMVTAIKLHQQFPELKLGIVDCDHHYGNGTDDIIYKKSIDYIKHYTFGTEDNHYNWKGGPDGDAWIQSLPHILDNFSDCGLILYQAGADPHMFDPCGGALSYNQLVERDDIVFKYFSQRKIPVAWNLAGGYQTPLENGLLIHDATLEAALRYL